MKKIINPKIGILTYSYINNYGAQLQAECLYKAINSTLNYDSEFIIPVNLQLKGRFKEPPGKYYLVPIKTKNKGVDCDHHMPVDIETKRKIHKHLEERYDIIIVGSDEILRCPDTVFWLPNDMKCKKIMLAPSCFSVQKEEFKIDAKQCLEDFDILTYRDEITKKFYNSKQISREYTFCPDPSFICNINHKLSSELVDQFACDKNEKILLLSLYKIKTPTVDRLVEHYQNLGFKIINIKSLKIKNHMDWFALHGLATICITDKFHGTISCLLNKTKVIGVESTRDPQYSKMKDLYNRFNLLDLYLQKKQKIPHDIDRLIADYDFDNIDQTVRKFNNIWSKILVKVSEISKNE